MLSRARVATPIASSGRPQVIRVAERPRGRVSGPRSLPNWRARWLRALGRARALVSHRERISQCRIRLWASLIWGAGHRGVDVPRTPHLPGPSSQSRERGVPGGQLARDALREDAQRAGATSRRWRNARRRPAAGVAREAPTSSALAPQWTLFASAPLPRPRQRRFRRLSGFGRRSGRRASSPRIVLLFPPLCAREYGARASRRERSRQSSGLRADESPRFPPICRHLGSFYARD
jgi:hypothetical protein